MSFPKPHLFHKRLFTIIIDLALSPGHSHLFNVGRRKGESGLGTRPIKYLIFYLIKFKHVHVVNNTTY